MSDTSAPCAGLAHDLGGAFDSYCRYGYAASGPVRPYAPMCGEGIGKDEQRGGHEPLVEDGVVDLALTTAVVGGREAPRDHWTERRYVLRTHFVKVRSEGVDESDKRTLVAEESSLVGAEE